jgi:hypothetical protein
MEAMTEAIGPIPSPPDFGAEGKVEMVKPFDPFSKVSPQVKYNPPEGVKEKEVTIEFASQLSDWNKRAASIAASIQEIIRAQKERESGK